MNLLKKLLPKDSFYLILFACIGLVGASAVWVSKDKVDLARGPETEQDIRHEGKEKEIKLDLEEKDIVRKPKKKVEDEPKQEKEEIKAEPKEEETKNLAKQEEKKATPDVAPDVKPEVKTQTEEKAGQEARESEAVTSNEVVVENAKLKKPVDGKIIKDFAQDKLVYSKTLEEWSVHLGIDIAAKEGTNVLAPLDGIVKQVIDDERLGITIVLDHGNGLETIYKNINTSKLVNTGNKVKTGDVISKVSKGVGFEKLDEPHLHFEVMKSGISVDPKSYF